MTNAKSTKRALLASVMALLLCFTMLLGTTFAWFTDSVTSGSNVIQSGTLKIDLVDVAGNSKAGEVIKFVTADDREQDAILWEPGCTYETEPVRVVNNGTLALKYQIVINGIDGDAKLLEAIDWTVTVNGETYTLDDLNGHLLPGENSGALVLSGHMKETAGNEYQNLKAEGISISVFATQYTSENDSFNNQYDKDAGYNYGKTNVGPYKLNVLPDGIATYDDATKTYNIAVNTVGQGSFNAAQGNKYYAGYTVNVAGYDANATVSFDKPDGTTTVWKLADEEKGGFIIGGVHQQWTSVGTERAYRYDIDGDGVTDFTVVNDVSDAKVEVANAEQLQKVLNLGNSAILTANINISESLSVAGDVVLDLNGYTLTTTDTTTGLPIHLTEGTLKVINGTLALDGTGTSSHGTYNSAIGYEAGTELVVDGVTFKGVTGINGTWNGNGAVEISVSNSTFEVSSVGIAVCTGSTETVATVTNCNIAAGQYAIFGSQGSKITVNGGTYTSVGVAISAMNEGTVITVEGGTFTGALTESDNGQIVIKGGTFSVDPAAYLADGYVATESNGTWTVTAE